MRALLILLVMACVGAFAWDQLKTGHLLAASTPPPALPKESSVVTPTQEWRPPPRQPPAQAALSASTGCDGRTRCTQMRSCGDARAQMHCPGAAMDGDNDGVPCEDQWCR